MSLRFSRNKTTINEEEQITLQKSHVAIIGCGGLGGYIAEFLCRIGIGTLTIIDFDTIDESNLNRQIISHSQNIGQYKVDELKNRCELINPDVQINARKQIFDQQNASSLLNDCSIAVDALDSIKSRKILQEACKLINIPLVHGAIAGFYGQVCSIFPNDQTLDMIYPNEDINALEKELGNPSFTPACIASIQCAEVIKILLNRGDILRNKMLFINMLNHEYEIIDLKKKA